MRTTYKRERERYIYIYKLIEKERGRGKEKETANKHITPCKTSSEQTIQLSKHQVNTESKEAKIGKQINE